MKNSKILSTFLICLTTWLLNAQDFVMAPAKAQTDFDLPTNVDTQIKNKMQKILTQMGVSGTQDAVFALVPQISVLSEKTSSGIPPVAQMEYEVTFSVMNVFDGKSFASYTFQIDSKGSNKSNALSVGIKKINLNTSEFIEFLQEAKNKTISYYEKELPKIIQRANTATNTKKYEEALSILAQVPQEIKSYDKVLVLIEQNFKKYEQTKAKELYQKAKALWSANKDEDTALKVADLVSQISSDTPTYKDAVALLNSMDRYLIDKEKYQRKMQEKQMDNTHSENKARIEAARAVGIAHGQNSGNKIILWK